MKLRNGKETNIQFCTYCKTYGVFCWCDVGWDVFSVYWR